MKTRLSRFALAVGLLAMAWPALAHLLGGGMVAVSRLAAAHPSATTGTLAAVLLLGVIPGPVDRALTRIAGSTR